MAEGKQLQWSDIPNGERVKFVIGKILDGDLTIRGAHLATKYKTTLSIIVISEDYLAKHPFFEFDQLAKILIKQKNNHNITLLFVRAFQVLLNETFDIKVTKKLLTDALVVTPLVGVLDYQSKVNGYISSVRKAEKKLDIDLNRIEIDNGCDNILNKYETTKFQQDFLEKAREKFGDKYEYYHLPNVACDDVVCWCQEHGEFVQRADVFLHGHGCPDCVGYQRLSPEERQERFIRLSKKRYGDMFDYSLLLYVNKNKPVLLRCKKHNHVFQTTPDNHVRRSSGCPYCHDSVGENAIRLVLERYNVLFETEHVIPNENLQCRRSHLRVDFWLPMNKTIIEFHGEQHFRNIPHFHLTKDWTFEDQQIRDQTLREYCQKHKIVLVEIRYDQIDKIENILKEKILGKKN